jgi:DNA modification methylase
VNECPKIASLTLRRVPIGELLPHPRNPRKHPLPGSAKWQVLVKSLAHDYFDPLVWNERNGFLVSGHFRRAVFEAEGYEAADVSVVDYDEETHLARMVAANRLLGEFEEELLAAIAGDLDEAGIDAALAGYTPDRLAALVEPPAIDDDSDTVDELLSAADRLQEQWQVQPGNIFQIGGHRLLCGDCTDPANWKLLLEGSLADMVWTDPPYNVDYEDLQQRRNDLAQSRGKAANSVAQAIINDDLSEEDYSDLLTRAFVAAFQVTKPGGAIYVAHADHFGYINRRALTEAGFYIAQCLIWVKSGFTLGRQDYQWQHEPILYGWKPGAGHYWQGGFAQSTVIDDEVDLASLDKKELVQLVEQLRNDRDTTVIRAPRNTSAALHPTIKPLPLVARQIWNSSHRGDAVVELFGGSGTTLLACEETGRRAFLTELDPKYCAVILERAAGRGLSIERLDR